MSHLASYLQDRAPEGMDYPDALQLCLRLYCTVDGVPSSLLPLSKEALANAFAALGKAGWVRGGPQPNQTSDAAHWTRVVLAIFKGSGHDLDRGEVLARQAGFVGHKGKS